ncbi:DUF406 family protein [Ferrimonas marina]|uniref:Uncharacterized conserved protein YfcZ, UPF0381/DUF406 family n=1 Tax=Ferrimonas marina TaxID=299255 RepID=A0A1M5MDE6_9GAMM|nr:DUF406 family protein [Ferrimonas marina]SHG75360.1 Uncharacterized conserved protein YfcZ, UPF0381/DUF406 family [Ferrimonas marina]
MENKTQDLITECCGAFMDVGAVIAEEDTVLSLPITADNQAAAEAKFAELAERAKKRFDDVQVNADWQEQDKRLTGTLTFSCAAERLIFEMELQ